MIRPLPFPSQATKLREKNLLSQHLLSNAQKKWQNRIYKTTGEWESLKQQNGFFLCWSQRLLQALRGLTGTPPHTALPIGPGHVPEGGLSPGRIPCFCSCSWPSSHYLGSKRNTTKLFCQRLLFPHYKTGKECVVPCQLALFKSMK